LNRRQYRLNRNARRESASKEQIVYITTPYITLGQLLKHANLIGNGGQARSFLEETPIEVNGEPEARRGKKVYPGDSVSVAGTALRIQLATEAETEPEP
jgi:ribosome-associated protein YbcJ (S4-like RNA binding protein)